MKINIGPANDERKQEYIYEGFKFILKAHDPYGFIRVTSLKDNRTLNEQFTDFDRARQGARLYATKNLVKSKKAE